jgi:hypothetical protein
MSTVNDKITTELNSIIADRNTIRDTLCSEEWGKIGNLDDNLNSLATKISNIATYGKIEVDIRPGETYTIPQGYHRGTSVVTGLNDDYEETQRYKLYTPTENVTPMKSGTKAVTPPEGYYGLASVTVDKIPDPYHDVSGVTASASDVLPQYKFVDSTGKLQNGSMKRETEDRAIQLTPSNLTYEVPVGRYYDSGVGFQVRAETTSVTITPTAESQSIEATDGYFISHIDVDPIPSTYVYGYDILSKLEEI